MTVSTLTVLAAFLCALELVLGGVSVAAALRLRSRVAAGDAGPRAPGEQAAPQALFLPGIVLAGLSALSIPLLYLLLRSWVPQWQGSMCVRGIVRIGETAGGATGLLPTLLATLVVTKPLLVFAAGAWIAVHLADRRTATGPLARRVVTLLGIAGAVALLDATAQGAYLLIPKVEPLVTSGCCTTAALVPGGDGVSERPELVAAALVASAVAAALAASAGLRAIAEGRLSVVWSSLAAACAVGTLWSGGAFLGGVLAPSRLRLPFHGCVHCLLDAAPEYALAVALALVGAWCAGWAAVVSGAACGTDADIPSRALVRRLLAIASFALPAAAAINVSGWRFA